MQDYIKHIQQSIKNRNPKILDLGCGDGNKSLAIHNSIDFKKPSFTLVESHVNSPMHVDRYTDFQEYWSNDIEQTKFKPIKPHTFKTIFKDELHFIRESHEVFDIIISCNHIHFFPLKTQKLFLYLFKKLISKNGLIYLCVGGSSYTNDDDYERYLYNSELELYLHETFKVIELTDNKARFKEAILYYT
ncbi:MAG: hypothetical protein R2753_04535 [Chitinophagales bacterium]